MDEPRYSYVCRNGVKITMDWDGPLDKMVTISVQHPNAPHLNKALYISPNEAAAFVELFDRNGREREWNDARLSMAHLFVKPGEHPENIPPHMMAQRIVRNANERRVANAWFVISDDRLSILCAKAAAFDEIARALTNAFPAANGPQNNGINPARGERK